MKYFLFITINNILSQEEIDILVVLALSSIFSLDDLIKVISIYLRGIFLIFIMINISNLILKMRKSSKMIQKKK